MDKVKYISEVSSLRQKAEDILKTKSLTDVQISETERLKLMHELEVHEIELELQNEELMQTRLVAQHIAEKYLKLYDAAPSGFFTISNEGKIMDVNLFGSQMLGKEKSWLNGKSFKYFVSSETQPVYACFLEKIFENSSKETCEITLIFPENQNRFAFLTGIGSENKGECLITAVDITERKHAIESLIEHQRLGAIGEMVSSIAHDFNNSLQSILGNLDLAISNPDAEKKLHYLKITETLLYDASSRVHQLQRFSGVKQEANIYALLDLNALIADVIDQSRPLWITGAEQRGLTITIRTALNEIPEVCGNDGELRTAIFNMIKNSVEAMPKGGEIFIETRKKLNTVFITISDTGIGMSDKTKARIFQPFFSTKGVEPGRGLGMSGVFNIVKEHGGKIYVKNTAPGKGTTLEIMLPAIPKAGSTEGMEIEEKGKVNECIKILWVEDDESINIFAGEMIRFLGHEGDTVSSGKEALELLEKKSYDLIITDIGMPEMNGWQLAEIIKERFDGKMNVVVISGWGAQIKDIEKIKYGIKYVLNKPFNIEQFRKLLENIHLTNRSILAE